MKRRRFLALDPGTACGYCFGLVGDECVVVGEWNLNCRRHEGGGMRFLRLRQYLSEIMDAEDTKPDAVFYEENRFSKPGQTDAREIYGGIVAILASMCEERGIPYEGLSTSTIKKHATGKGNAKKKEVEAAIKRKCPFAAAQIRTDNMADAVAIFSLACELYGRA